MNRWQWLGAAFGVLRRLLGTSSRCEGVTNVGTEESVPTRATSRNRKTTRKKVT